LSVVSCQLWNAEHGQEYLPMPPFVRRRSRGFTLLEVLATLLLMAIVLPVVMNGITLATGAGGVAASKVDAATLAEGKLNELAASPSQLESGHQEGDFGEDHPGYQWTADVDSRDTNLLEVSVQVQWEAMGRKRALTLTTWKYVGAEQQ
jgi:type II secretion system protein I